MKQAYLNCSSGIAGDMFLAAFIDAGIPAKKLERLLGDGLRLKNWHLEVSTVTRYHFPAKLVNVRGDHRFRSPNDMKRMVQNGKLPPAVKAAAIKVLSRLIEAEAQVHGVSARNVHFHELNSLDTMIDIVGACTVLYLHGIEELRCSPVNVGSPAPAALAMLKGSALPVFSKTSQFELATPTGIAIVSTLVQGFGEMPLMKIERYGYGAGTQVIPSSPNVVKVIIGSALAKQKKEMFGKDSVVLLSTNIDDMDPRVYPYVMDKLFQAGARDAWLTPVTMKKGRPGIILSVICEEYTEEALVRIIFTETTTLGIRRSVSERYVLERAVRGGRKTACLPGGGVKVKSEYEISRLEALKRSIPLYRMMK